MLSTVIVQDTNNPPFFIISDIDAYVTAIRFHHDAQYLIDKVITQYCLN